MWILVNMNSENERERTLIKVNHGISSPSISCIHMMRWCDHHYSSHYIHPYILKADKSNLSLILYSSIIKLQSFYSTH